MNGRRSPGIRRAGSDATARLAQPAAPGTLVDAFIYYHGTAPSGNSAAIGNGLSTASGRGVRGDLVTWSLSEPFSAHEWFPCKQILTDKADSSDVWVTTTLPNKVGSNGVLARTVMLPNNKVRYEWKSRHPIDYYLISVAIAPYVEYVSYANPVGGPRIPIVDYVYDLTTLANFQVEIDRTAGFIENYSNLFGMYPFANEKYGHSMAPIGGGMEHQTMTTQDGYTFTLTAHELCHQWWGDNVTCGSWEDIWLNEGFASYGEYLSLQAFPTTAPFTARAWLDQAHNYALNATTSIYVEDTTNVGRIFNYYSSYKKGASVIHMLRYLLNDDVKFFRALRTYQSRFANSTARTADLQAVFEAEAGRSLNYFFQQWFRGQGYPIFTVRWNQAGGTFGMNVVETTSQPAVTPFYATDVSYKLTFTNGTSQVVRLRQGTATANFAIPVTGTVRSVEVDPDQWILNQDVAPVRDSNLALATAAAANLPQLSVFPVPCTDYLRVSEMPKNAAQAWVLDATGRVVRRVPLTVAQPNIAVQSLAQGLYFVRVVDANGHLLGQARFSCEK